MSRIKLDKNNNDSKSDKSKTMIIDTENELNNYESNIIYKDFELNSLNYEDALRIDKRTYIKLFRLIKN